MNTTSDTSANQRGDAVEDLLRKVPPRPAPPSQVESDVRAAVREEWLAVSGRSRRRRMGRNIAAAATVFLAFLVAFSSLRQVDVPLVEVAQLETSYGTLQLQGGDAADTTDRDLSVFLVGQVLQTGADSAAGLKWQGGGSLRIDAQTRIEFVAANEVYLHSGRVYFDSLGIDSGSRFAIRTRHGVVSHVGTQVMTEADASRLIVSVREGEVRIAEAAYEQTVHRGQRAELVGSSRPLVTNTSGVGGDWAWVESVAPRISVDGMSAYEFLHWVGRETGFEVQFSSPTAERFARITKLIGDVTADPRTELRLRMMTMDLDARFDKEGALILVSD
jgi:ferric-dicitrate binding protein FerR (iron transport regulator)